MKAVIFNSPGGPEVLEYSDHPDPSPRPGEAVVQLQAASLNAADLWVRRPGMDIELPHISGSDGAGVLVDTNGECAIEAGEAVVINPALPSGAVDVRGRGPYADIVRILGYDTQGTYAELVSVPIPQLFPKPEHLSMEEAAAIPLTFLTAWRMLISRAQVRPRERVLVWGATGGLGSAAVVLASQYCDAEVIAAVGSDSDAGAVSSLGAAHVINYKNDPAKALSDVTHGAGVEVVFESVGAPTWSTSLSALRPGGRLVIAGTTGGDIAEHDLSDIFYYQWSILGCRMGNDAEFGEMLRAVGEAGLRPAVAKVFDLAEAASAQKVLESSDFVGKLVLRVP